MSMIRNTIMPLLSTLAALVIIVHTAEDFKPDYRELRPRALDTGTTNYEQGKRTMNVEPIQPSISNQEYVWRESNENEPYRRRRPGRKRKWHPENLSSEDIRPQKRHLHQEENQHNHQEEYRPLLQEQYDPNPETPRRRRKKNGFRESGDINRPVISNDGNTVLRSNKRRRGHKRRLAGEETIPEFSEFGEYLREVTPEQNREISTESKQFSDDNQGDEDSYEERETISNTEYKIDTEDSTTDFRIFEETTQQYYNDMTQEKDNNLLSELAIEKNTEIEESNKKPYEKIDHNISNTKTEPSDELKDKRSLDPSTLKELLKRSNGRSLSEILQQNNLSLSDLLNGKEKALSIFKEKDNTENKLIDRLNNFQKESPEPQQPDISKSVNMMDDEKRNEKKTMSSHFHYEDLTNKNNNLRHTGLRMTFDSDESNTRNTLRQRYPVVRRKLRTRPVLNNTHKGQLSRDLLALTSMKYHNNRNISKFRDRRKLLPSIVKFEKSETDLTTQDTQENYSDSTTFIPVELTSQFEIDTFPTESVSEMTNAVNENDEVESLNIALSIADSNINNTDCNTKETTTTEVEPEFKAVVTEKPRVVFPLKIPRNASSLIRKTLNDRLQRKRMKQLSSNEAPQDYAMKNILNMANLQQASEFIAKTKIPTTNADPQDDYTTLEDFITTELTPRIAKNKNHRKVHVTTMEDFITTESTTGITKKKHHRKIPVTTTQRVATTSEVTAKIEIQEILNDTMSNERLSKILKERNMTLNELLEQRERGSSHVHLADIFHNASKEPNPPEPFLTKSSIEPISKETYPLRALLEANQHDPKATTIDSLLAQSSYLNKPIVMDFGNNVNENSENRGIISLFDNFTKSIEEVEENIKSQVNENEQIQNNKKTENRDKDVRDGRALNSENTSLTWNKIISFMQKHHQNESNSVIPEYSSDFPTQGTFSEIKINMNPGDDTLKIIEENFDNTIKISTEEIEMKRHENVKLPHLVDIHETVYSNTKSVTVATAGLIGLSLVVFLLTYSILKWRQQSKMFQNKTSKVEDIPSPIFENRKGLMLNSSTRSKSPMISPSNIYTVDSLDTHKGNDSPEYMWDSLRKPYQ